MRSFGNVTRTVIAAGICTLATGEAAAQTPAFQPQFVSERGRTLTANKTAIMFIDESPVKLNAGAVLTMRWRLF